MKVPSFDWLQDRRLSEFIDISLIGEPNQTLAQLSGDSRRLAPDDFRTGLMERVEEAWFLPIRFMTCEHFRLLVSQQMGLEWIAEAVAEFVDLYPRAKITNYEGEVSILALVAIDEIQKVNPKAASRLRSLDYSWMHDEFAWDEELQRQSVEVLKKIRN